MSAFYWNLMKLCAIGIACLSWIFGRLIANLALGWRLQSWPIPHFLNEVWKKMWRFLSKNQKKLSKHIITQINCPFSKEVCFFRKKYRKTLRLIFTMFKNSSISRKKSIQINWKRVFGWKKCANMVHETAQMTHSCAILKHE